MVYGCQPTGGGQAVGGGGKVAVMICTNGVAGVSGISTTTDNTAVEVGREVAVGASDMPPSESASERLPRTIRLVNTAAMIPDNVCCNGLIVITPMMFLRWEPWLEWVKAH